MNVIQEETDECSLSGLSFLSLDRIYLQEEGGVEPNDTNESSDDVHGIFANHADGSNANGRNRTIWDNSNNGEGDDGYPTDEHTVPSLAPPKEQEMKRLSILELAHSRLSQKKVKATNDEKGQAPDDEERERKRLSYLQLAHSRLVKKRAEGANGETDQAPDESSFLDYVDVVDVENKPDDSSFLANAAMDDAPGDDESIEIVRVENEIDSYYDVHASTLSRASASTKASTIGDRIRKEPNVAAHGARNGTALNNTSKIPGDDSQSASTYSYRRAFDNATLGSSYYASTCSALTDEYCFDVKRTGMSEAIKEEEDIERAASGPVDADTGAMVPKSDDSREESLALPPPHSPPDHSVYENPDHLMRIVSFGEGEGYVDEATTRKFAPSDEGGGFCSWFASSSRIVKLVAMFSVLLLMASALALLFGFLRPEGGSVRGPDPPARSRVGNAHLGVDVVREDVSPDEEISLDPTGSPTPTPLQWARPTVDPSQTARPTVAPSTSILANPTVCDAGASCVQEGSQCTGGTTETCCDGETLDSLICDCAKVGSGNLIYLCFYADPCLARSCETVEPSVSTSSPMGIPTPTPTRAPESTAPSKAPESAIFTTLAITSTPTKYPSKAPTLVPSKGTTPTPTQLPTQLPTQKPSFEPSVSTSSPTGIPTPTPTEAPKSTAPSKAPESVIFTTSAIADTPTKHPSKAPTLLPSIAQTQMPTQLPAQLPTQKPSNQTATILPTPIPTGSPIVSKMPTEAPVKMPTDQPTTSLPTKLPMMSTDIPTSAATLPPSAPTLQATVPPGCPTAADLSLAFKQALMPEQKTASVNIVFPSQDSYVGGGIHSDENYGAADDLVLNSPASKVLIQFELGFIPPTKRVVSASLRMFVNSVSDATQLSIHRLPSSFDWDETRVAMDNFGIPPMADAGAVAFRVSSSDNGRWVNVDVNDFIDGSRALKLVLSASDGGGKCVFASRETCHSSKLLVVTESI